MKSMTAILSAMMIASLLALSAQASQVGQKADSSRSFDSVGYGQCEGTPITAAIQIAKEQSQQNANETCGNAAIRESDFSCNHNGSVFFCEIRCDASFHCQE